jgi:hypothetical protein
MTAMGVFFIMWRGHLGDFLEWLMLEEMMWQALGTLMMTWTCLKEHNM